MHRKENISKLSILEHHNQRQYHHQRSPLIVAQTQRTICQRRASIIM